MIERDTELLIWSLSEDRARRFFGIPRDRPVRVVKEHPETPHEIERYAPTAKLYAIRSSAQAD